MLIDRLVAMLDCFEDPKAKGYVSAFLALSTAVDLAGALASKPTV